MSPYADLDVVCDVNCPCWLRAAHLHKMRTKRFDWLGVIGADHERNQHPIQCCVSHWSAFSTSLCRRWPSDDRCRWGCCRRNARFLHRGHLSHRASHLYVSKECGRRLRAIALKGLVSLGCFVSPFSPVQTNAITTPSLL